MRIAISGTHCVGKTTLIDDLISRYPEYQSMKEVYYELLDEEDGAFALEPTIDNMLEQLDASIEQLEQQDMEKILFLTAVLSILLLMQCMQPNWTRLIFIVMKFPNAFPKSLKY